ncbi:hypothetical protein P171DRAFT_207221 [Karstenula rhodostoma CBS 690.94]|uniref:Uncharacterized protein n=1 Tax=Karstenula rhodostoma CBS 690.94 TaxID=1392251 RepID=A0A9P4PQ70_9PLEO|nr:hypothetical protein P171DRAFT_207221 [Karstenula rhodostoma CBS 690.94]
MPRRPIRFQSTQLLCCRTPYKSERRMYDRLHMQTEVDNPPKPSHAKIGIRRRQIYRRRIYRQKDGFDIREFDSFLLSPNTWEMVLTVTRGGIRIRGFEGALYPQVTCSERESPVVPTPFSPSLESHGYCRNVMVLPHDSGTILDQTERLCGYDEFEIKRRHFDFEELGTDDEAANWPEQPAESGQTKDAVPLSALQQLNTLGHQGCDSSKAGYPKEVITFPSPHPPHGSLRISAESPFDQPSFDINTDNEFGQSCVDDCDCDLMPDLMYDDEIVPERLHHVPGSELEPDFDIDTGPDMVLTFHPDAMSPFHPNAIYENRVRSDPLNIDVLQKTPKTTKAYRRRATRSGPECSRDRHRRNPKARAQCLRDRSFRSASIPIEAPTALRADSITILTSEELKPRRKHCAFVQEQELRCLFEDRVGTPHLSELQPGDDVNAQLNVDELSVGGEVAALSIADGPTQGLSAFAITDIPNQELGPG